MEQRNGPGNALQVKQRLPLYALMVYTHFSAVEHDCCWLGLSADADVVVEGRVLSDALRKLKVVLGECCEHET